MQGASALAERPHRLEKVFLNTQLSNNGIYGCQMYAIGIPVTVTIDDSLPIDSFGDALFARVSDDKALWGPLIEKCFAKLHGNYEAIEFGNSAIAIDNLHGSPSTTYRHRDKQGNAVYTAEQMFNLII